MKPNIKNFQFTITKSDRELLTNHKSHLIWLTGLSGSGKSTLANLVEIELNKRNILTYVIDGDNIRQGINSDLNFEIKDRIENIRRISELSKLLVDAGIFVIACFISPFSKDRLAVKNKLGQENFSEIYINSSIESCEKRDVKGLYKKARKGEIKNFTGISSPYETPINPDLEIKTDQLPIKKCSELIINFITSNILK